jgi:hypothetical protein
MFMLANCVKPTAAPYLRQDANSAEITHSQDEWPRQQAEVVNLHGGNHETQLADLEGFQFSFAGPSCCRRSHGSTNVDTVVARRHPDSVAYKPLSSL